MLTQLPRLDVADLARRGSHALDALLQLFPDMVALLHHTDSLVARVNDAVPKISEEIEQVTDQVSAITPRMEALLEQTDQLVAIVNTALPRVANGTGELLEEVNAAVPRLVALLDQIELLLEETNALIKRVEGTHPAAPGVMERTGEVVTQARTTSHELREAPGAIHRPHLRRTERNVGADGE